MRLRLGDADSNKQSAFWECAAWLQERVFGEGQVEHIEALLKPHIFQTNSHIGEQTYSHPSTGKMGTPCTRQITQCNRGAGEDTRLVCLPGKNCEAQAARYAVLAIQNREARWSLRTKLLSKSLERRSEERVQDLVERLV